mgnify:CR=1 FL=1
MRYLGFAVLGLCLGVVATYGAALVWNPDSYESAIPLILAGAVLGPAAGVLWARRMARRAA